MLAVIIVLGVLVLLMCVYYGIFHFVFVRRQVLDITKIKLPRHSRLIPYIQRIADSSKWTVTAPNTPMTIQAADGVTLYARFYPVENSHATILLFHGYRSRPETDFACAFETYQRLGLNVLLVDQRAHGKSGGQYITFGVKESTDCRDWLWHIYNQDKTTPLFLGGMSMGSTTVLLALKEQLPPTLRGVMADCGFTSPDQIIRKVARSLHIPGWLFMVPVDWYCRTLAGFSMFSHSTLTVLAGNEIPVLLIHGKADGFVPCDMSVENYRACKGPKRLVLVEKADHGFSFLRDEPWVTREMERFIAAPSKAAGIAKPTDR